jgi:hypothetical protein
MAETDTSTADGFTRNGTPQWLGAKWPGNS